MNWDQLEANWKDFAGSARAHWSKLTDDDRNALTGKKEQLAARIQHRYGIEKHEAERQVEEWSGAVPDFVRVPRAR